MKNIQFIRSILLCACLLGTTYTLQAQTCHRVYVNLVASRSYYVLHGSNSEKTVTAMANAFSVVADFYQTNFNIEMQVGTITIYKTAASDPFNGMTKAADVMSKMEEKYPTIGGFRVEDSPYDNRHDVLIYDMYLLFLHQTIYSDEEGRYIRGYANIRGLYTTKGNAMITQRAMVRIKFPNGDVDLPVTVSEDDVQRTTAHETGHLLGAHDVSPAGCTNDLMCSGSNYIPYEMGETPTDEILDWLDLHHDTKPCVATTARFAAANADQVYEEALQKAMENSGELSIHVFPNPTSGLTTVRFNQPADGEVRLNVYNSLGQIVCAVTSEEEFVQGGTEMSVNMSEQGAGLYVFELKSEGHSQKVRVSVER